MIIFTNVSRMLAYERNVYKSAVPTYPIKRIH